MYRPAASWVAACLMMGTAAADTAYVKPSTYSPDQGETITVEVAFNDYCCEPRYAVRTDTYEVIAPDGTSSAPERVESFAKMTVLEHTITAPGTTRISTGERLGRKGEYVLLDGIYHLVNSPDADPITVPERTPILSSQTATVTDAYVTVGTPDWGAIRTSVGRLAIEPALHPNSARVGGLFIGRVMMDGAPVTDKSVLVTNEVQRLNQAGGTLSKTDEDGIFTIVFTEPGTHVIMVRLQAPAPAGAETDIRSYTTALTLQVAPD
ncbi:MAG: DUF4198 domain-containing protein [Hyphomonadaceae bacterium]|nr:DUF4198 domain-containing protein [Hyphomonadaceae bacterium]